MISTTRLARLVLCALFVCAAGCGSLSASSGSLSKVVLSPLTSSSRSSSPDDSYAEDVSDLTASHVKSGGSANDLRRDIGSVAKRHGVTDWESNPTTYRAVGAGLKQAGYTQSQVESFAKTFADTADQESLIQKGYDGEK